MEFILIGLTALYFVMGFGVQRLWREIVNDDAAIAIVVLWPIVLIVAAIKG